MLTACGVKDSRVGGPMGLGRKDNPLLCCRGAWTHQQKGQSPSIWVWLGEMFGPCGHPRASAGLVWGWHESRGLLVACGATGASALGKYRIAGWAQGGLGSVALPALPAAQQAWAAFSEQLFAFLETRWLLLG